MTTPRPSRCRDLRQLVLLCLGMAMLGACVTSSVEPAILSIQPPKSYTDHEVRLTIHTSGVRGKLDIDLHTATDTRGNGSIFQLLPVPELSNPVADAAAPGANAAETAPEQSNKPRAFTSVVWAGENIFTAEPPRDLTKGKYTVQVTNPDGHSATSILGAFESLGKDETPPQVTLRSPADGSAMLAGKYYDVIFEVDDGYGVIAPPVWWTVSDLGVVPSQPCVPDGDLKPPGEPQRWRAEFMAPVPANHAPQASFQFQVKVTDGGANHGDINTTFTAVLAPEIEQVSPPYGGLTGGTSFVMRGTNFLPGARVFFGEASASNIRVFSSEIIVGNIPPSARPGIVSISVETLANQKATIVGGYRYLTAPRLRGIEPATGPIGGEIQITAKGTDFREQTRIFVGTGPGDKRELLDCVTVLPPNKVTGCLVAAPRAETVKVWAEDPDSGGSDADALEFAYVQNPSGVDTASSPSSSSSSSSASSAPSSSTAP